MIKPKFKMGEKVILTLDGKETEGEIIGIYGLNSAYYDIKVPETKPVDPKEMPRRINMAEKELRRVVEK